MTHGKVGGDAPAGAGPMLETAKDGKLGLAAPAPAGKGNFVPADIVNHHRVPVLGEKYTGLLGNNFLDRPLLARLNWLHTPLLLSLPMLALYGAFTVSWNWRTVLFTVIYYYFSGFGITMGYHRLWSHNCYKAAPIVQYVLAFAGSAAVEGSIRWWSRDHRAHHKYVDTDQDPYSAVKGFFYAHMGWMLVKQDPRKIGPVNISDLNRDPLVRFQHKYYLPLALFAAFVVPMLVCGLGWGDYYGGFFVGGVIRLIGVHHSTFFVNSLAHYAGAATYTDGHTARNSIITALLTLGEGYHNFHHEFPSDYRNGLEWYQWDPTKVLIRALSLVGLTYDLKRFPHNEIAKGVLQMKQKELDTAKAVTHGGAEAAELAVKQAALDAEKAALFWGPDPTALPTVTADDVKRRVAAGEQLVILAGFVVNVSTFMADHPGGAALISDKLGSDITTFFKGELDPATGLVQPGCYKHSNAANNLVATFRVARLAGYWS